MQNKFDKTLEVLENTFEKNLRGYSMNKEEVVMLENGLLNVARLFNLDLHRKNFSETDYNNIKDENRHLKSMVQKQIEKGIAPPVMIQSFEEKELRQKLKEEFERQREQESSMAMLSIMVALFVGGCAGSIITYFFMR